MNNSTLSDKVLKSINFPKMAAKDGQLLKNNNKKVQGKFVNCSGILKC